MKRSIVLATIVIAVTSFAHSQTRYSGTSKQGVNIRQTIVQMEHEWSLERTTMKGTESLPQCNLTFITESLPDFTPDIAVNFQIDVCCGTPPYHFEVVEGTLPEGLHLNQNGKITGVSREEADTTIFVKVTDRTGCSLTQAFQVRVVAL